jgi:hypothetical protein
MKTPNILYWSVIVILLVGCTWLFMAKPTKTESRLPNTQYTIDSLNGEISSLMIDNGRYEYILNQLWEADSNFVMEHTKYVE